MIIMIDRFKPEHPHYQTVFVYCGQLNALEAFAWLIGKKCSNVIFGRRSMRQEAREVAG